jgi:hypothetical protein
MVQEMMETPLENFMSDLLIKHADDDQVLIILSEDNAKSISGGDEPASACRSATRATRKSRRRRVLSSATPSRVSVAKTKTSRWENASPMIHFSRMGFADDKTLLSTRWGGGGEHIDPRTKTSPLLPPHKEHYKKN